MSAKILATLIIILSSGCIDLLVAKLLNQIQRIDHTHQLQVAHTYECHYMIMNFIRNLATFCAVTSFLLP